MLLFALKTQSQPGMVAHTCNSAMQEVEEEDKEVEASLSYVIPPSQ